MRLQSSSTGGLAVGEADNRYLRLAGGTMTGELNALAGLNTVRPYSSGLVPAGLSDPAPAFPFETQWNNAGKNWTAFRVSVTNTASGSASKLADFQVAGASAWSLRKDGAIINTLTAYNIPWFIGRSFYLTDDYEGSTGVGFYTAGYNCANINTWGVKTFWGGVFGWAQYPNITNPDTAMERDAAGVVKFTNAVGSLRDWKARRGSLSEYLDITEMSAPAAPAANTARLYVEDNGSGKTRLMVLFPTGAAQVLATEP